MKSINSTYAFLVFLFPLACFLSFRATGQTGVITGFVLDTNRRALAGASVVLQKPAGPSPVGGTATDSAGRFGLTVAAGSYRLLVTMSGFEHEGFAVVVPAGKTIAVGPVLLRTAVGVLQEAVVTATRSPLTFEAGKTIVTPAASLLTAQGNLFEALRQIPGLVVQEDGTLILNGQKGVNVLVDGKETYLSGTALVLLLKATLTTSVDRIELLTHPSAQYDASGTAGLVNIRLKKPAAQGFTLSAHQNYQQGKNGRGDMGVRTTFRNKRSGVGVEYSFFEGKKAKSGVLYREYRPANATAPRVAGQRVGLTNSDQTHNLRLMADWELSRYITADVYGAAVFFRRRVPGSSHTRFSSGGTVADSVLGTSTQSRVQQKTFQGGVRTVYKDAKKNELNFSVDRLSFRHQDYLEVYSAMRRTSAGLPAQNDTLAGRFDDQVRMWSAQTNYLKPLPSNLQFQAGVKLARVRIDNHALYYKPSGAPAVNGTRSSLYDFKEHNSAAYLQLGGRYSRWSFLAGVRAENTRISGTVFDMKGGGRDSGYAREDTELFPSLALHYSFTGARDLSLTYNRRITRPNYRDQSPSGYTVDEYLVISGNTGLQAELTHLLELAFILKKLYRAAVYYTCTDGAIAQGFREREGGGLLVIPENMEGRRTLGVKGDAANLVAAPWWKISSSGSLFYTQNRWTESARSRKTTAVTPTLSMANSFSFRKGWGAQLTGYYNGKMALGQMEVPAFWSVSGGVRKKMLSEQLNLHLYVNDMFASVRERAAFGTGTLYGYSDIRYDETNIGLSLHYHFKKGKQKELPERSMEERKRINF